MSVAKRRERERAERSNQILDAAQRCFYAQGFDAATMDDVAVAAQLGKGTLYNYFRTKEELLLGVAVRRQEAMLQQFDEVQQDAKNGAEATERLLLAFARGISTPSGHLRLVMSRWVSGEPLPCDSVASEQAHKNIRALFNTVMLAIRRGQEDGSIRGELEPAATAMKLWSATYGALLMGLKMGCLPKLNPLREMAPSLEQMVAFYVAALRLQPAAAEPQALPRCVGGKR